MPDRTTPSERRWREWVLGEGRYRQRGPRSQPRPDFGYGGPGQEPIPREWWQRLEQFIARRDSSEPGRKSDAAGGDTTPLPSALHGQLTAHFNLREFDCHDGRRVPAIAVAALTRLCGAYLEPLRRQFGPAVVLSGYRPADYNARIGGARYSQHIYELTPDSVAADLTFARGTPPQWAAAADALGAGGVGTYPSFVHIDNRPGRSRWP